MALILIAVLVGRLYELQVIDVEEHTLAARRNSVVVESSTPSRGRILDSKGRTLVGNSSQLELVVVPAELRNRTETIAQLARILEESPEHLEKLIATADPHAGVVVRRDLTLKTLTRATELAERSNAVEIRSGTIRNYPYGKMASHLFGYVQEISIEELRVRRHLDYAPRDLIGKIGLERQYDSLLRGVKGLERVRTDVLGRTVSRFELKPPSRGADLHLHLDAELQQVAEKALGDTLAMLEKENGERSGGTVVVMDVRTGAVRALASLPQYDQQLFSRGIRNAEYQALLDDPGYPLVNRMIHSSFSPGSTFKMITASAALQAGLCTPMSHFYCGGSFGTANCFVRSGHGGISFEDSLAHSCDVVYYQLGFTMGIDHLRRYCAHYGLGSPTGIDLPEETAGLLPSPEWKEKVWEDEWYGGDTVNMSIGQGFLLVSPLQMAVATAAVANGGFVVRPTLLARAVASNGSVLEKPEPERTPLPVKSEFLEAIRRGMRGAVTRGTATVVDLQQVEVAGKTGTVENDPSVHNRHGRNHVWFVSFAPYRDPEVTVVVFLEKSHGYGGGLAAPVARDIYEYLYPVGVNRSQDPEIL